MAGLLDSLINNYGNQANNPYATPQPMMAASQGPSINVPVATIGSLIDSLGRGPSNPYANVASLQYMQPSAAATAARQGVAPSAPAIPYQQPSAAATAARQGINDAMPMPDSGSGGQPTSSGDPVQVPDSKVAQVDTQTSFPSASDYNADGTQAAPGSDASAPAGGLLGSLAGAASDAVTDPVKSKGFLGSLGDAVSGLGDKLKGLSPAASQGLIAAGMTMLANNNGRNNLAQLVGMGGEAGVNQYQNVNMNRIMMLKNQMDVQHMQAQDAVAAQNAATEQWKATHPTLAPDQAVVNATGDGGAPVTSGVTKSYGTIDQAQPDGSTMTFQKDISGMPIPGTGVISKNPNVGPLNPDQLKVVNPLAEKAAADQQALQKTQTMLTQLQNVNIPAGLKAKGADLWSQLTGDQSTGQVLRNQLQQQTYQNFLSTWKPGIGGRLTNTDVNLLKQGMPPDTASSATWSKFLTSYGRLQADLADQSSRASAFARQNRGDLGAGLTAPVTINGVTYPQGSTYQQVMMGQGGTNAQQSGQNSGNAGASAGPSQNVIAQAQAAARSGDANAQAALRQRGLSW